LYEVDITREDARHLDRLPAKVRDAAVSLMLGALAENPRRVGKPLVGRFAGLWSARRGDYRIVYEIDENAHVVLIHRVQQRRHVYRRR
jgi:mRNA-degrading endonuclease RelE of RelBE toxin-antitoxin system